MLTTAPDARREFQQLQLTMEVALPDWGGSLSWVFTGIYVQWANTTYDGLVKKVKDKIGG